jgi:phosphoribosylaminoimidazolecarboxamide formyltransferase/IMP cyclohydrolase
MSTVQSPDATSTDPAGTVPIRTALFSVWDKTGVAELAAAIAERGGTVLASGGTAGALREAGVPVTSIEEYTGLAHGFGGRVKTLHPKIHAGILARRDVPGDLEELEEAEALAIDLVCVNLYPFEEAVAEGRSEAQKIEKIDVGGPTMLRAAAKNWKHVAAVCDPADMPAILDELAANDGALGPATRRRLAAKVFARTSAYDAAIGRELAVGEDAGGAAPGAMPARIVASLAKVRDLRYGENPHQRAALYAASGVPPGELPGGWRQLAGAELSYNNWVDLVAAAELALAFDGTAAVIVKHTNPCGVALARTPREAWELALSCDPVSAFGGVVALNRPLDRETADVMSAQFLEVVVAPGFDAGASELLGKKKKLRLVEVPIGAFAAPRQDWRALPAGVFLVQDDAGKPGRTAEWKTVSRRAPTEEELRDLEFAWIVVASVKSNAIVFARDGRVLGVGAGQMSRVDSVRIAIDKARELGHDLEGSVVASDAFFPFADGPELALEVGATAIVQPGGSKRDADTLAAVDRRGRAMVFTGRRVFRH